MRGEAFEVRIIPARAGFTMLRRPATSMMRDHPRSRGVYDFDPGLIDVERGSSPLARGLHGPPLNRVRRIGIIPARAGFTPRCDPDIPSFGDHPRSRGVYRCCRNRLLSRSGSSPLARGLLILGRRGDLVNRIIPARAGFTADPRRPAEG